MAWQATHNSAGLTINGIIHLGPTGATVFYWIISALGAGFALAAFMLAGWRIARPQSLEVGTYALLLPYGRFLTRTAHIAYSDIQDIAEIGVTGERFLYVSAKGLRYTIVASLFPDNAHYVAVRDYLISHAPH
jgi:hypothetical protein